MVGVAGFEPTASSSRTKRATKLRHTPPEATPAYRTGWVQWQLNLGPIVQRTETLGCELASLPAESRPPTGAPINVSSVASGRQQNRTGANGEVPTPAETCNCMVEPQRDGPLARDRSSPQLVTSAP